MMALLLLGACAQVPKESVELSATVGRDMAIMEKAHIAMVELYYDRLYNDINKFIDQVYMPYQVRKTLGDDDMYTYMTAAIADARNPDPKGVKQQEAIDILSIFVEEIQSEVEVYRLSKLSPVKKQEAILLTSISESYKKIYYANSIVTGHLASVVSVHDMQNELLAKVDLKDLRSKVSVKTTDVSNEINALVKKGQGKEAKLDKVVNDFNKVMVKIGAK